MSIANKDKVIGLITRELTEIPSIYRKSITSIGDYAFYNCSNLTSINLPAATSIGIYVFGACSNLTSINLPAATSIGNYAFRACSNLKEIHFSAANKATIQANSYYSSKWGATNATIYFDLNAAKLTFTDADGLKLWVNGGAYGDKVEVTADEGTVLIPNETAEIVAYDSSSHALYLDSVTAENTDPITKTITRTTGNSSTITVGGASASDVTIKVSYNGILLDTVTGNSKLTVSAPSGTTLSVTASASGYSAQTSSIVIGNNWSTTLKVSTDRTISLSYPFTTDSDFLTNLVDGTNFEIAETPTVNSGSGIKSSIINGSKSFKVNSGVSFGYIKFHTPATTDTDLLKVSVTCACYAESSYDVGLVYVSENLVEVTGDVRNYVGTSSAVNGTTGYESSKYGHVLFYSRGNATSTYYVNSTTLKADTDYYLCFAYTKDSSANSNWDRLSITNITFSTVA